MGMKGPYKKSAQLEVLQGMPGKRGLVMRPDGEQFKKDARWAMRWAKHYERLAKEEILAGVKHPTQNVRMMLTFRQMAVNIKARLLVTGKPEATGKGKWEGMITSA
jgi:hypothetical protein